MLDALRGVGGGRAVPDGGAGEGLWERGHPRQHHRLRRAHAQGAGPHRPLRHTAQDHRAPAPLAQKPHSL